MKLNYGSNKQWPAKYLAVATVASALIVSSAYSAELESVEVEAHLEQLDVIADRLFADTHKVSPSSKVTAEELQAINLSTAEDAVAYEPSLVVRRRYVGDPNGVLGIRGSGMFQTARSLVFADGLPLHYLLQTRWSGSPRWSLVGANEIATAEVIYGPFSAEYAGNAMGGVVDIKTKIPSQQKITINAGLMAQSYDRLATEDDYLGRKLFISAEDKFGDLAVFASYNRLNNKSQPMSNYRLAAKELQTLETAGVSGYLHGKDQTGADVLYIGDSGTEVSNTELYKIKINYDVGSFQWRATVAYEDRLREEKHKNNYLVNAEGNTYWGLGNKNFEQREHNRSSLLLGLGVSSELENDWFYDIYATDFSIKKDVETRSGLNPEDPSYGSKNGRKTTFDDTGWNTLDIKLGTEQLLGNDAMRLSLGVYYDSYSLSITPANIDANTGSFISARASSQGQTSTQAFFTQWGWQINSNFDLSLGLRYENWETKNGHYKNTAAEDRSDSGLSPKFSLAYLINDNWKLRYSLAKALRFPIAEELYRNEEAASQILVADASLAPEQGLHHNIGIERQLEQGLIKINLFYDQVDNTIYNQRGIINDNGTDVTVSTFLAIDQVETRGVEFIYHQQALFGLPLSLRYNLSFTDSEISRNTNNQSYEGNELPRVPAIRSNMIINYTVNDGLDLSASFRYSSDSFNDLNNSKQQAEVYGAIDDYFFVNAKLGWQMTEAAHLSVGVDNLFDDVAFVAHPWPSRTVFVEGRYTF